MANRKATFAKRQRETDLKDRAKAKEDRRSQKRNETRDTKGPQIAWDEAVRAVSSDELPSLSVGTQDAEESSFPDDGGDEDGVQPRLEVPAAPGSASASGGLPAEPARSSAPVRRPN